MSYNPFEIIENRLANMEALLTSFIENYQKDVKSESDLHLTVEELSAFLHKSKSSIYKYLDEGMPSFGTGRTRLFSKKEVLEYMRIEKSKNNKKNKH